MKIQKFKKRIGLIGFGCVGQGLYDVVEANRHLGWEIGAICVKDKDKPRNLPAAAFTYNVQDVLQDPTLDIVAELISEPDEAINIIRQALQQGKTVVSANKKAIAEHLPELIQLQQRYGGVLLYEASVCGSIPVLRMLEAYYGTEPLASVRGILNGSSNYILSRLHQEGGSYAQTLQQAQQLGFAEADPALDVEGVDALHKLCILAAHAFGVLVHPDEVLHFGINHFTTELIELAKNLGARIRLVGAVQAGDAGEVSLWVLPTLLPAQDALFAVEDEFNAVEVEARFAGKQFLKGRGAGSHPTGSAVWADINAAVHGYRYTYPKLCTSRAQVALPVSPVTVLLQGIPGRVATLPEIFRAETLYKSTDESTTLVSVALETLRLHQQDLKSQGIAVLQVDAAIPVQRVIEALATTEAVGVQ
jgi:homoserine dehydrogenase